MRDETGFLTTWGREFAQALRSLTDKVVSQDAYEVLAETLGEPPTLARFWKLTEREIVRLRDVAEDVLGLEAIDLDLIRQAITATRFHWPDPH